MQIFNPVTSQWEKVDTLWVQSESGIMVMVTESRRDGLLAVVIEDEQRTNMQYLGRTYNEPSIVTRPPPPLVRSKKIYPLRRHSLRQQ